MPPTDMGIVTDIRTKITLDAYGMDGISSTGIRNAGGKIQVYCLFRVLII